MWNNVFNATTAETQRTDLKETDEDQNSSIAKAVKILKKESDM